MRWIRSYDSARTARTPSNAVPLAAQSRDDPDPYSVPARISSGVPVPGVIHRGVVDSGHRTVGLGEVASDPALGAGCELVAQPDVGEGAADHHFVVAAGREP